MNLGKLTIRTLFIAGLMASSCNASGAQADASAAIPQQALPNGASSESQFLRAARLTFVAGSVRVQRSDNTGDDTAVLNMPLGEGTRILTGDYGEAEIEFEDGSVARLTPRTALSLNKLALGSAQTAHSELGLLGGLAYFELRKTPAYTWLLDAGGTRIAPLENLTLRLNQDDGPPVIAVIAGSAHVERPDVLNLDIHAGETLRDDHTDITGYALTPQLAQQSWDSWNESRDRAAADAAERHTDARNDYAGDQGYGWSDLDANGNWYNVPGTGQVWQPDNADEGFDPYGYGAWVWGNGAYVWASGYPWGWTPYRCGHWQFFNGFGWGWIPDFGCGRWAFAGGGSIGEFGRGGVFVRGPYPPRHNPVIRPFPRPGQPHPVVPVRGPDGPRPWTPHGVRSGSPARPPFRFPRLAWNSCAAGVYAQTPSRWTSRWTARRTSPSSARPPRPLGPSTATPLLRRPALRPAREDRVSKRLPPPLPLLVQVGGVTPLQTREPCPPPCLRSGRAQVPRPLSRLALRPLRPVSLAPRPSCPHARRRPLRPQPAPGCLYPRLPHEPHLLPRLPLPLRLPRLRDLQKAEHLKPMFALF